MKKLGNDSVAAIVDGILKFIAGGGFITTALVAPNSAQVFDKPLHKLLDKLDSRSKERELRRIAYYMKRTGLISYTSRDYEHGIQLTSAGKKRLKRASFSNLTLRKPSSWDGSWRLIFFDIPLEINGKRIMFTSKLKRLGFQQLQKSIWIHPFPCRPEIEIITSSLGLRKYVTYVEISHIDAETKLRKRFKNILP